MKLITLYASLWAMLLGQLAHGEVLLHHSYDDGAWDSRNGNHGALVITKFPKTSVYTADAKFGAGSLKFTADSRVDLESTITLADNSAWAISFWFKSSKGKSAGIIGKSGDSNSLGVNYNDSAKRTLYLRGNGGSAHAITATSTANPTAADVGVWHHYVVSCNGQSAGGAGAVLVYEDGQLMSGSWTGENTGLKLAQIGQSNLFSAAAGQLDELWVFDNELTSAQVQAMYAINNPAEPPASSDDVYQMPENAKLQVSEQQGVLHNDHSAGGSLIASLHVAAEFGTVELSANGSFTYTPNAGFDGIDEFVYRCEDGASWASSLAKVRVDVSGGNDAPVANADSYEVCKDWLLNVPAAGVLANDVDPEGDDLSVELVSDVSNGQLDFNVDGSFVYKPSSGFEGVDSFSYRAIDGQATSSTVTVNLDVKPKLKVFLLAGQSNMWAKQAVPGDLAADSPFYGEQDDVLFYTGGSNWSVYDASNSSVVGNRYGPDVTFGHAMSSYFGEQIGLIKSSEGGTNLYVEWRASDPVGENFAAFKSHVLAAQASRDIEIIGMLWMQGETDTKTAETSGDYAENLASLIRTCRAEFNAGGMLFVAGRVNPPVASWPYVDVVRSAQENIADPNYTWIGLDQLPKVSDNVHYTAEGIQTMGYLFADAIASLFGDGPVDIDGDGMAESWEHLHFNANILAEDNPGGGIFNNVQKYVLGFDPLSKQSDFYYTSFEKSDASAGVTISWPAVPDCTFNVLWSADLNTPFIDISGDLHAPRSSYTDEVHHRASMGFYKVKVTP